ncbi:MAG: DEAD/DEAH box helicase family protein [Deltaproteobacteria bacterium]|nr:DEAD/DEAH box helicase family protein [Deltaproteobacteria bacterium]
MFSLLSNETAESVRSFLNSVLPEVSTDWWSSNVTPSLSFQQQRMVEEKNIVSLSGLDLAALLRILDKSWYDISAKRNLGNEARTWTREMQLIRNKWAHAAGTSPEAEDLYRDLDTLQRFLGAIQSDNSLVETVREKKLKCLTLPTIQPTVEPPIPLQKKETSTKTEFIPGDLVCLKSDPTVTGAVMQVIQAQPENRYLVFAGTKPTPYYASQLVKCDSSDSEETAPLPLDAFHAHLTALHLQHPGLANLYSLHSARIDYIPYQFKPVMKLIRSDRPRILIADEVGVGKTIEAGLILKELQARRDVSSVLIICPRPLVSESKWRNEMKRFDEDFAHLDGATLRYCIDETDKDGEWPSRYTKAILPFSLFNEELLTGKVDAKKRRSKGLLDLDPPPHFDLVIVDEAHHLRNSATWLHRGIEYLCSNAEAVVFLTATPVQLGANDLFVLLNLLRPDYILDSASFQEMSAPNPFINQAIELARRAATGWDSEAAELLMQAADTSWGKAILQQNPDFQRLFDQLGDRELSDKERIAFVRGMERQHTFSNIINRTRRRDIGTFTTRKPETVEVLFTAAQQVLHDGLMEVQRQILKQMHGEKSLLFMMTTIRRQAASCIYGLAPLLKDILSRKLDFIELDEVDYELDISVLNGATLEERILEVMERAEELDPTDPKLEALQKIITNKQKQPNNKILLFSSFRHTLAYLLDNLKNSSLRIGYIHGGTPDEERREQRNRFSLDREEREALDILLSSEVGCEGLDYQFCDCLVNYDLPWNPMRVEQRIGRIDRYGQKSDTVAIYNLITPDTVDFDIYHRCLWRIGVFHAAIGGSEEIIGKLTSEIRDVAENLTLTNEERQARLQQLSDNEVRIVQEQSELEEQQGELFGLRLPQQKSDEEVEDAESFWLTPNSLARLVRQYLGQLCGENQEYMLGDKPLKTLRIGQEGREALLADFRKLPRKTGSIYRDWEKWLKGSNPHLSITFDAKAAAETRSALFTTPVHPLALQASRAISAETELYTVFHVYDELLKPGSYPFAIYHWQKTGIRDDVSFQPVLACPEASSRFLQLLELGEELPGNSVVLPDKSVIDALDTQHHALWVAARLEHVSYNSELVGFRRQSLTASHAARMAILQGVLQNNKDTKIQLMKKSELERAEADFARRMMDLDKAEIQVDLTARPVAFGVMVVD